MRTLLAALLPFLLGLLVIGCSSDTPTPEPQSTLLPTGNANQTLVTADCLWPYNSRDLPELLQYVDHIVIAEVSDIAPGHVIQRTPSHTPTHFTYVSFNVLEDWSAQPLPEDSSSYPSQAANRRPSAKTILPTP